MTKICSFFKALIAQQMLSANAQTKTSLATYNFLALSSATEQRLKNRKKPQRWTRISFRRAKKLRGLHHIYKIYLIFTYCRLTTLELCSSEFYICGVSLDVRGFVSDQNQDRMEQNQNRMEQV